MARRCDTAASGCFTVAALSTAAALVGLAAERSAATDHGCSAAEIFAATTTAAALVGRCGESCCLVLDSRSARFLSQRAPRIKVSYWASFSIGPPPPRASRGSRGVYTRLFVAGRVTSRYAACRTANRSKLVNLRLGKQSNQDNLRLLCCWASARLRYWTDLGTAHCWLKPFAERPRARARPLRPMGRTGAKAAACWPSGSSSGRRDSLTRTEDRWSVASNRATRHMRATIRYATVTL